MFLSFFFFRDVFLLFFGLPLTENSLRYDWTVVSDKQNSLAFLTLDENIRLIDKALFSNIFKYIVSYKDIKSFNLERLDFNLI
jgi:hypothetical protein